MFKGLVRSTVAIDVTWHPPGEPPVGLYMVHRTTPSLSAVPPRLFSLSPSHLCVFSPKEQMCPSLHKNKLAIHHLVLVSHFSSLPIMKATESRSCHVLFCFFKDYPCDFQWSFFFLKIWWLWVFENRCLFFPWLNLLAGYSGSGRRWFFLFQCLSIKHLQMCL